MARYVENVDPDRIAPAEALETVPDPDRDGLTYAGGPFHVYPNTVMRDLELSEGARILFGFFAMYAGPDGASYPSRKTLAADLGVSIDTIDRRVLELRRAGLLTVKARRTDAGDPTSNLWILNVRRGRKSALGRGTGAPTGRGTGAARTRSTIELEARARGTRPARAHRAPPEHACEMSMRVSETRRPRPLPVVRSADPLEVDTVTGRPPRTRSSGGARCEFPSCVKRAGASHKRAVVTISGRPVTVERLCAEHRAALEGRTTATRRARDAEPDRPDAYRCLGCGRAYTKLTAAETCADAHGGARIAVRLERKEPRP